MEANLGAIPTRAAAIVDRLRNEIREGTLAPGTRLRQAHLAAQFGVSTTPIREAFAALEREGLLQSSAHRGVMVFEPSIEDLQEIYEIRIPLEAHATELAVPKLSEASLKEMRRLLKGMAAANKKGELLKSGEFNDEFHSTIYQAAERPRLAKLIGDFRMSSRAYIGLYPGLSNRLAETEHEHEAILEACEAKKAKAAAKAMAAHLRHTVDVVAEELDRSRA